MLYSFVVILCLHTAPCKKPVYQYHGTPIGQFACDVHMNTITRTFTHAERRRIHAECREEAGDRA